MQFAVNIWFKQIRGPFLILAVLLVFIGLSAAKSAGFTHGLHSLLLMIGVVQTHIAVNLFNEISDYQTGIDSNTVRTPFSGGSGMLQSGKTHLKMVKKVAIGNLIFSGMIGFYFCIVSSPWILLFMIAGGLAIRFYTSHLAKWMMGEWIAGLTLGSAVVLGVYLVLTKSMNGNIVLISVPPGILTTQLLFLNEFPDADADRKGGRHHWVIGLGKTKSAVLYCILYGVLYIMIGITPWIVSVAKAWMLGLVTLPLAVAACVGVCRYRDMTEKLVPYMGLNVIVVLTTDLLLGAGLLVG